MGTGRKTRLRRILRRKRVKRAIKAYGNYIAAGVLVFVVCVLQSIHTPSLSFAYAILHSDLEDLMPLRRGSLSTP